MKLCRQLNNLCKHRNEIFYFFNIYSVCLLSLSLFVLKWTRNNNCVNQFPGPAEFRRERRCKIHHLHYHSNRLLPPPLSWSLWFYDMAPQARLQIQRQAGSGQCDRPGGPAGPREELWAAVLASPQQGATPPAQLQLRARRDGWRVPHGLPAFPLWTDAHQNRQSGQHQQLTRCGVAASESWTGERQQGWGGEREREKGGHHRSRNQRGMKRKLLRRKLSFQQTWRKKRKKQRDKRRKCLFGKKETGKTGSLENRTLDSAEWNKNTWDLSGWRTAGQQSQDSSRSVDFPEDCRFFTVYKMSYTLFGQVGLYRVYIWIEQLYFLLWWFHRDSTLCSLKVTFFPAFNLQYFFVFCFFFLSSVYSCLIVRPPDATAHNKIMWKNKVGFHHLIEVRPYRCSLRTFTVCERPLVTDHKIKNGKTHTKGFLITRIQ